MKCEEKECSGEIDTVVRVSLMTSCGGCGGRYALAHPCNICGRVHWPDGHAVFNRPGHKVYLENGEIVHRDPTTNQAVP